MTAWHQFFLIYALPPLQLFPSLLCRIKVEGILLIPIAPAWPRRTMYVDILNLLADKPWAPPGHPDLLSNLPTWFTVTGFDESPVYRIGCAFLKQSLSWFFTKKLVLRPQSSFLHKVASSFLLNQNIVLPSFCPNPKHPKEKVLHYRHCPNCSNLSESL